MDEETIKKSFASLSPETLSFVQQYSRMAGQSAEFERMASTIRSNYRLNGAYSLEEVMQACKEVCSHWPVPAQRTMSILAYGGDKGVIRDFVWELAALSKEG